MQLRICLYRRRNAGGPPNPPKNGPKLIENSRSTQTAQLLLPLFLATTSILPSLQAYAELHALSSLWELIAWTQLSMFDS